MEPAVVYARTARVGATATTGQPIAEWLGKHRLDPLRLLTKLRYDRAELT